MSLRKRVKPNPLTPNPKYRAYFARSDAEVNAMGVALIEVDMHLTMCIFRHAYHISKIKAEAFL